jgi:hypothetical protein
MFVPGKPFHPGPIFAGKAWSLSLKETHEGCSAQAVPEITEKYYIRGTNTLDYFPALSSIMKK